MKFLTAKNLFLLLSLLSTVVDISAETRHISNVTNTTVRTIQRDAGYFAMEPCYHVPVTASFLNLSFFTESRSRIHTFEKNSC